MKKILTTLFVLLSVSIIAAPPGAETNPSLQLEVFVESGTDGGIEAIYKSQEEPIQPVKQKADSTTPLSASEQLEKFMDKKGFGGGWNEEKQRIFVLEEAGFDCESPAADPDFLVKREIKVKEAILRAKIKIIESINSEMSASELLQVPGSPLREKFDAKIEEANKKLNLMKRRLKKLEQYMDKSEADMLAGVTWSDRGQALMDAIIKKLNEKFSTGEIEAKKKAKYEKSKDAYESAKLDMQGIEKEAAAMKGEIQSEMTSSVAVMAEMPLFGATVIAAAESWNEDEEKYEVAVLVCWSNTMQRAATAMATGKEFNVTGTPKQKETLQEWLKKQDLAVMSGPRQFLDADGNRWFLGISARALPKSSSKQRKAKSLADIYASQMAIFCIYSDLASKKAANQMMQTRNAGDKDSSQVAESISEELSQSFKNKNVRGLSQVYSKKMVHPISGEKIYVSIYGINPSFAKKAQELEAKSYGIAVQSNKYQAEGKGRKDGLEASVEESKNDNVSYNKGYDNAQGDVGSETKKLEDSEQKGPKKQKKSSGNTIPGKSQSGTYMGDSNVSDDF